MARYSEEDISKVREATDVVSLVRERVDLRQKGREFWGCCPFHKEKTPSFKVNPDTGLWHCFGCGEGGDAFGFIMRTDNLSFPEAVAYLADKAHIELVVDPQAAAQAGRMKRLRAICEDTATYYADYLHKSKTPAAVEARRYLAGRDFGSEIALKWRLGYAPGRGKLIEYLRSKGHRDDDLVTANVAMRSGAGLRDRFFERVMFPITDVQGRAIAFGGRILGSGEPKYLNTSETPLFHKRQNLYGLDHAKQSLITEKTALVVEGYTDVIALHRAGHSSAVATLGTALTAKQVAVLSRYVDRIVYLFDGDEAGLRAADRAVEYIDQSLSPEFAATPVKLDVALLPMGNDPADMMDSPEGQQQFAQVLKDATPLLEFAINRKMDSRDLGRPEERARALKEAAMVLVPLKGSLLVQPYAEYIADCLTRAGGDFDQSMVLEVINSTRAPAPRRIEDEEEDERVGGSDSSVGVTDVDALPRLTQTELVERELLALVLQKPSALDYVADRRDKVTLSHPLYREALSQALALRTDEVSEPVAAIDKSLPGVARLCAAYEFDTIVVEPKDLAKELVMRLQESALERQIRIIRGDLQKNEGNKALLESLYIASKELHRIRARRYQ